MSTVGETSFINSPLPTLSLNQLRNIRAPVGTPAIPVVVIPPQRTASVNSVDIPRGMWAIHGLLCAKTKTRSGKIQISLNKLERTEEFIDQGQRIRVGVKPQKFHYDLSLEEVTQLALKLPYLVRAITASDGKGSDSELICDAARNEYNRDLSPANASPPFFSNGPGYLSYRDNDPMIADEPKLARSKGCQLSKHYRLF